MSGAVLFRRKGSFTTREKKAIIEAHRQKVPMKEIRKRFHTSVDRIRMVIGEAGK